MNQDFTSAKGCDGCSRNRSPSLCGHNKETGGKVRGYCFILRNAVINDSSGHFEIETCVVEYSEKLKCTFESLDYSVYWNDVNDHIPDTLNKWGQITPLGEISRVFFILIRNINTTNSFLLSKHDILSKLSSFEMFENTLIFIQRVGKCNKLPLNIEMYPNCESSCDMKFSLPPKTILYCDESWNQNSNMVPKLCDTLMKTKKQHRFMDTVQKLSMITPGGDTAINNVEYQSIVSLHNVSSDMIVEGCNAEKEDLTLTPGDTDVLMSRRVCSFDSSCYIVTNQACGTHTVHCNNFKKDRDLITKTFAEDLCFDVRRIDDIDVCRFGERIVTDLHGKRSLVCVILSCGFITSDYLPIFFGKYGKTFTVKDITGIINQNKAFLKIPKLFFVVVKNCRKDLYLNLHGLISSERKGVLIDDSSVSEESSNTFIHYVSINDDITLRSTFITALCQVLKETSKVPYNLCDIELKLNKMLHPREAPCVYSTLKYQVYFGTPEKRSFSESICNTSLVARFPPCATENLPLPKFWSNNNTIYETNSREIVYFDMAMTIQDKENLNHVLEVMITTENDYVSSLQSTINGYTSSTHCTPLAQAPDGLHEGKDSLFENIKQIYEFHMKQFSSELSVFRDIPLEVGRCFLKRRDSFKMYTLFNTNKPRADQLWNDIFFRAKENSRRESLDESSNLEKPAQRLAEYDGYLKELIDYCHSSDPRRIELMEARKMIDFYMRHAEDLQLVSSIANIGIPLEELGCLIRQNDFYVFTGHYGVIKRLKRVFLFDNAIVFTKTKKRGEEDQFVYQYSMKTSDLALTENIGKSELKFEVLHRKKGRLNETYVLQASNPTLKKSWTSDLSSLLMWYSKNDHENNIKQPTTNTQDEQMKSNAFVNDDISFLSSSGDFTESLVRENIFRKTTSFTDQGKSKSCFTYCDKIRWSARLKSR